MRKTLTGHSKTSGFRASYSIILCGLAIILGQAGSAAASISRGPFVSAQTPATGLIQTDGETLFIEGIPYPVPAELKPTAPFTFWRTPSKGVLYSFKSGDPAHCSGGARIYFHHIPLSGNPLVPIVTDFCIPLGIAWERFYDQIYTSPQQIAAIVERLGATAATQRISWFNLATGEQSWSSFAPDIEGPALLTFAQSGTAALVRYDTRDANDSIGGADYRFVDLCPGSLGAELKTYHDLGGLMTAEVVESGGNFSVLVSHELLPGGHDSFPLADCLGPPPPAPPGTLIVLLGGSGSGTVFSSTGGIYCPGTCEETVLPGSDVTLSATADPDSSFRRWTGDCTGTSATVIVSVTGSKTCTAEFNRLSANLSLSVQTSPDPLIAGNTLAYTFAVRNLGPNDATGVILQQPLPSGLQFVSSASGCTAPGSVITCNIGSLAPGATTSANATVQVDPLRRGTVTTTATVSAVEFDPAILNNSVTINKSIVASANLSVQIQIVTPVIAGGLLAFQIAIHNDGPSTATGVVVSKVLAAELRPVGGTGSAGGCGLELLGPGQTRVITALAEIDRTVAPGTALSVAASVSALEPDPDPANNSAALTVSVSTIPPAPWSRPPFTRIANTIVTGIPFSFGRPAVSGEFVTFELTDNASNDRVHQWVLGNLLTLADRNTWIPDGVGQFTGYLPHAVSMEGANVAFDAYHSGYPGEQGVYYSNECGLHMAINQDTPLPNPRATRKSTFFLGPVLRRGAIAFAAANETHTGVHLWDGAGVTIVADRDTTMPGRTSTFGLNGFLDLGYDGTTVVFIGQDASSFSGVYAWSRPSGPLVAVADKSMPVPGGSGPFTGFSMLSVDDGQIAFTGFDPAIHAGIYLHDVATGNTNVIVDAHTPVPGGSGTFDSISRFDLSLNSGRIAFIGASGLSPAALYLYEGGTIRRIIGIGDLLDGRAVAELKLGSEGLRGSRLAFSAFFIDQFPTSWGWDVYLANLGPATLPTPTGANVTVRAGEVKLTIAGVTTAGQTRIEEIDPATAGTLPGQFSLGFGLPAFEITTTATYTGPITVCVPVSNTADFARLRLLHGEAGVLVDRTILAPDSPAPDLATRTICARVNSLSPFAVARSNSPTAAPAAISGTVNDANGSPLGGVTVQLSGERSATTFTRSDGTYRFENLATGAFYTLTPALANHHFSPGSRAFSLTGNRTDAVFTANSDALQSANASDTAEYFVRQHYLDFLGREPDQGGFDYWSAQINQCDGDAGCIRRKRIDVSNAFFFEPEFQETGAFVYRVHKAAFGQRPGYSQFMPDRTRVIGGLQLDQSRTDLADAFVQRSTFTTLYPNTMTAAQYVDALNANTGNSLTALQRDALIAGLNAVPATETRGSVLRQIADNQAFIDREYNQAFVLTQYFGYLRRDPDQGGYDFWLGQVNRFPIRDLGIQHTMVCSFITSAEYQQRFSPVVTHTNAECP